MAVMVQRETPHKQNAVILDTLSMREALVRRLARKNGWTINPTRRSETARLQIIVIELERIEGDLFMAVKTKRFPAMDMNINGALRTQIMTTAVSIDSWLSTIFA